MIEAGLYNLLRSTESIADLVGTRIYPVRVPEEGSAPCIVYSLSNTDYTDGLDDEDDDDSANAEQTGPDTRRFRLECWGDGKVPTTWAGDDGYKQACTVAAAVETLLRKHKGLMGPTGTTTTIRCKFTVVEDVRDEETVIEDASDYHRYLRVVDVAIEYDPLQV